MNMKKKRNYKVVGIVFVIVMLAAAAYYCFGVSAVDKIKAKGGVSLELIAENVGSARVYQEQPADAPKGKSAVDDNSAGNKAWYMPEATVIVSAELTSEDGYSFKGWYEDDRLISNDLSFEYVVTDSTTLVAKTTANKFKIHYDPNSGEMPKKYISEYTIDEEIHLPVPTKDGYVFDGWAEDTDDDGNADKEPTKVLPKEQMGDKNFAAQWTPAKYEIVYELKDGELEKGKSNPKSYTIESSEISLNNPSKDGFVFLGWTGTELNIETKNVFESLIEITYGEEGAFAELNSAIPIVAGHTYKVTWNETEYELEAKVHPHFIVPYLGNMALWGSDDDSGEPFIIISDQNENITRIASNDRVNASYKLIISKDYLDEAVVIAAGSTGDRHYVANWEPLSTMLIEGADKEKVEGFNRSVPDNALSVVFTDEAAPEYTVLTDVSYNQDGGVVAWIDDTTYYVSTQRKGVFIETLPNTNYTFANLNNVKTIDLSNLDTTKAISMNKIFDNCFALESITFGKMWDTSNVQDFEYAFRNNFALQSVDVSRWDFSNAICVTGMFQFCENLTDIKFADEINTSKVESFQRMFEGCKALETVDVSRFDTSASCDFSFMFSDCENIRELDISNFVIKKISDPTGSYAATEGMLQNLLRLEKISVSADFNFNGIANLSGEALYSSPDTDNSNAEQQEDKGDGG